MDELPPRQTPRHFHARSGLRTAAAIRRSVDPPAPFTDIPAMKPLELRLEQMTPHEKLRTIETILEHLSRDERQVQSPAGLAFRSAEGTRAAAQSGQGKGARLGRGKKRIAPPLSLKIRILQSAFDDLDAGAAFYERQETGLGSYFMSSLIADIDSLKLYAGTHRIVRGSRWF